MNTSIWDPEQQPEQHYGSSVERAKVGSVQLLLDPPNPRHAGAPIPRSTIYWVLVAPPRKQEGKERERLISTMPMVSLLTPLLSPSLQYLSNGRRPPPPPANAFILISKPFWNPNEEFTTFSFTSQEATAILKHLDMCGGGGSSTRVSSSHAMAIGLPLATNVPQAARQHPTQSDIIGSSSHCCSSSHSHTGRAPQRKRSSLNSTTLLNALGFDSDSGPQAAVGTPATTGRGRDPQRGTEGRHSGYLHMTLGRKLGSLAPPPNLPGDKDEAGLSRPLPANASAETTPAARGSLSGAATGSNVHGRWGRLRAGALAAAPPHITQRLSHQPALSTGSDAQLPQLDLGSSFRFLPAFASHGGSAYGGVGTTRLPTAVHTFARSRTFGDGGTAASLYGISSGNSSHVHPADYVSTNCLIPEMMGSGSRGGRHPSSHGAGVAGAAASAGYFMLDSPPSIHRTISGASGGGRGGASCAGASAGDCEHAVGCSSSVALQDAPPASGLEGVAAGTTATAMTPPTPDPFNGDAMLREFQFLTDMLSSAHPSAGSGGSGSSIQQLELPHSNCQQQQGPEVSPFALLVGRLSTIAEVAINSGPLSLSIAPSSASLHLLSSNNNNPCHRSALSSGRREALTEEEYASEIDVYSDSLLVGFGVMGSETGTRSSGLLRDGSSGPVPESQPSQPASSAAVSSVVGNDEGEVSGGLLPPHATDGGGDAKVWPSETAAVHSLGDAHTWSGCSSGLGPAPNTPPEQHAAWAQVGRLCTLLRTTQQEVVAGGAPGDQQGSRAVVVRGAGGGLVPPGPSELMMGADGQQQLLAQQLLALLRQLLIPQLGPIGE